MYKKPAPELWLKPCGFGGHQPVGVRDAQKLFHGSGVHGKCDPAGSVSHFFQCFKSFYLSDKTDAGIRFRVSDPEDGSKDVVLEQGYVESADRVIGAEGGVRPGAVPCAVSVNPEFALVRRAVWSVADQGDIKAIFYLIKK